MSVNFHQQVKQIFGVEVVALRPHDDLSCRLCDNVGPVVVVKLNDNTFDFCMDCAGRFGLLAAAA